jgi:putative oxidoreductase
MQNPSLPLYAGVRAWKGKLRAQRLIFLFPMAAGIALGLFFFYAGLQKHLAPYEFAEAILAYRLIPPGLVGGVAAVLPWLELTPAFLLLLGYLFEAVGRMATSSGFAAGAALVGGIKRRSCLLLIAALGVLFIIVMAVTMARGLKIDCGCGLFFDRQVGPAAILENVLFVAMAGALYWWEYPGE